MNFLTDVVVRTAIISLAFWIISWFDADLNFSWEHFAGALLSAALLELYERNVNKHRHLPHNHHNHL